MSHPTYGSWRPLLTGDLAGQAGEAVSAIAAAVAGEGSQDLAAGAGEAFGARPARQGSLGSGDAGKALLFAYLALHDGRAGAADTALRLLDAAEESVAAAPASESLHAGFPGVAWAGEHLAGRLFEQEGDPRAEVDAILLRALSGTPWPGRYDLINGLVGLGVYALERLPRPVAAACLEAVVERLDERADRGPFAAGAAGAGPAGLARCADRDRGPAAAWFSPPQSLPAFQRETFPNGLHDLGVAHGLGGVIGLLGAACGAGGPRVGERALPLLDAAVRWLLARELPREAAYRFPHFYSPAVPARCCRVAWCYGDLGLAAALLLAARGAAEPAWEEAALRLARCAADRPLEGSGVWDAGLCHGAAGVGHLFNRLFQATGDETLAAAARRWFDVALSHRDPAAGGIGGFRFWKTEGGVWQWTDTTGFLEGAAGVALSLLAAISPVAPDWDRALLITAVPR